MTFRIAEVEGSIPFESTKEKCDLLTSRIFLPRPVGRSTPSVIEMLGRSECALRQFCPWQNACTAQRRPRKEGGVLLNKKY